MGQGSARKCGVRSESASRRAAWIVAITLALTTACRLPYIPPVTSPPAAGGATLRDASGRVVGSAIFLQQGRNVRILIDVKGLTPGTKAVHIHEVGQCEPSSFESAGGHFNPTKAEHGTSNLRGPHAGDLPNMTVEASGQGHLEVTTARITLEKGPTSLFDSDGSSVVVHDAADDLRTDPDGKSAARVACGVITRAG